MRGREPYRLSNKLRVARRRVITSQERNPFPHLDNAFEAILRIMDYLITEIDLENLEFRKPRVVLTTKIYDEVLRLHREKVPLKLIAYQQDISMSTVSRILKRKRS